jgi:hypothetical protein
MTKNFCKQCGSALTNTGAKFCTTCGATVDGANSVDLSDRETVALGGEKKDQTTFATEVIPAIAPPVLETDQTTFATEVIPAIAPPVFETEEIQQVVIATPAEERATKVIKAIPTPPVIQRLDKSEEPAPVIRPSVQQEVGPSEKKSVEKSGERKKLGLAAALGVAALVTVVAASILFINSRKAPEIQAENRPAETAAPSTPAQPIVQAPSQQDSPQPNQPASKQPNQRPNQQIGQPYGAGAKNRAQSQTRSQSDTSIIDIDVKPPTARNDAVSKPQQQAAAKPAQEPTGISAVEHQKQGADYLNKRLYHEALREFDFVKRLDPGNKDVYYLIGSAYNGMNQLERALEAYRQCTSGAYVTVSQNAVKTLEKKLGINAR